MIYQLQSSTEVVKREISRRKADNPLYSMNAFARRCGISVAYLSLLLNGKRKLTPKLAERFAAAAGWKEKEREYFLLLVKREGAPDSELRAWATARLDRIREDAGVGPESLLAFDVISDWHYSAILEAVLLPGPAPGLSALANTLNLPRPKVTAAVAKLVKLGLLRREGGKILRVNDGFLKTSTEMKSQALRNFHKQILKLGAVALDEQPIERRSCTGTTLKVDPLRLPEAKKRILEFQRELMRFLEGGNPTEIYQLQVQLFSLTERGEIV